MTQADGAQMRPNAPISDEGRAMVRAALAVTEPDALRDVILRAGMVLSPAEMGWIYRRLDRRHPSEFLTECRQYAPGWRPLQKRPRPWRHLPVNDHIRLYRSPNYKPVGGRTLLICMTDMNSGLLMQNTAFLQRMPDDVADVAIVLRPGRADFRSGLPAVGDSLLSIARLFQDQVLDDRYSAVAVMGVSQGANGALGLADLLGAQIGVAFSGRYLRVGGVVSLADSGPAWEALCQCRGQETVRHSRLYCIFGDAHVLDARYAAIYDRVEPRMTLFPVAGYAGHSVFTHLTASQRLAPVLTEICTAASENRPLARLEDL